MPPLTYANRSTADAICAILSKHGKTHAVSAHIAGWLVAPSDVKAEDVKLPAAAMHNQPVDDKEWLAAVAANPLLIGPFPGKPVTLGVDLGSKDATGVHILDASAIAAGSIEIDEIQNGKVGGADFDDLPGAQYGVPIAHQIGPYIEAHGPAAAMHTFGPGAVTKHLAKALKASADGKATASPTDIANMDFSKAEQHVLGGMTEKLSKLGLPKEAVMAYLYGGKATPEIKASIEAAKEVMGSMSYEDFKPAPALQAAMQAGNVMTKNEFDAAFDMTFNNSKPIISDDEVQAAAKKFLQSTPPGGAALQHKPASVIKLKKPAKPHALKPGAASGDQINGPTVILSNDPNAGTITIALPYRGESPVYIDAYHNGKPISFRRLKVDAYTVEGVTLTVTIGRSYAKARGLIL